MNKWLAILLGLVIIGAVALPFNHIGMMDEALACNTGTPGGGPKSGLRYPLRPYIQTEPKLRGG
jgi:hypothetical protein